MVKWVVSGGLVRGTTHLIVSRSSRHERRAVLWLQLRPVVMVRPDTIISFYFPKDSIYICIIYIQY
jgi:hypothetical protein